MRQQFPVIAEIALALRNLNSRVETECDVRLQVYETTEDNDTYCVWAIRYGDSSFDLDHRGYWGCSCIPGINIKTGKGKRFDSKDVARDLLEQVKDHHAEMP